MAGEEIWHLYVDESGSFEPGSIGVVAGWLVRDVEDPRATATFKAALEEAFPLVPYPPHATELNVGALRVVGSAALSPDSDRSPRAKALREICAPFVDEPRVRKLAERKASGQSVKRDELRRLQAWLETLDPGVAERLDKEARRSRRQVEAILHAIPSYYAADEAMVVIAAGRVAEEPVSAATGELVEDGYVTLLESLLERAVALLQGPGATRKIWLRVLTRDVSVAGFGRVELRHSHVARLAQRVEAAPYLTPRGANGVRVRSVEHVVRWNEHVHPGCVLADFIANRVGNVIGRNREWQAVVRDVKREVGLAPSARTRLAPDLGAVATLGTAGPLRASMHEGMLDDSLELAVSAHDAPWAVEQARQWVELGRSWRRARS